MGVAEKISISQNFPGSPTILISPITSKKQHFYEKTDICNPTGNMRNFLH